MEMTVDELLATLSRTSLPTVVVEGKDDLIVFRQLEYRLSTLGLSVLAAGGRGAVLELFNRRTEINSGVRVAFVADKDLWVMNGLPDEYLDDRLIFTDGYSIENDVIRDGGLLRLMSPVEQNRFHTELRRFTGWYAGQLHTNSGAVGIHPNVVLDPSTEVFAAPAALIQYLLDNFEALVRGKSLMALLIRQLSYTGRAARHHHHALMEQVATNPGPLLGRIDARLVQVLSA